MDAFEIFYNGECNYYLVAKTLVIIFMLDIFVCKYNSCINVKNKHYFPLKTIFRGVEITDALSEIGRRQELKQ